MSTHQKEEMPCFREGFLEEHSRRFGNRSYDENNSIVLSRLFILLIIPLRRIPTFSPNNFSPLPFRRRTLVPIHLQASQLQ
jgi:hypothetical protein